MESESAGPRHSGNQNRSRGSVVASIHQTIDWNHSSRVSGPFIVLDGHRPGIEITKVQRLLQARFILPYLTMWLKNRSSLVEMRVLWVSVGLDGSVQRVVLQLLFLGHDG